MANQPFSHDNIFHSVLGLTEVDSTAYNSDLDVFSQCSTKELLVRNAGDN